MFSSFERKGALMGVGENILYKCSGDKVEGFMTVPDTGHPRVSILLSDMSGVIWEPNACFWECS